MSVLSQFFGGGQSIPLAQGGGTVNPSITIAEVLLVAGGGTGASSRGGSSGAVIISSSFSFTQGTSYTITIGGTASDSSIIGGNIRLIANAGQPQGGAGSYRIIDEYTTSYGYGGSTGPSGGGGGASGSGYFRSGTTGPTSPGDINDAYAGPGGSGVISNISGITTAYGGGGGGGSFSPAFPGGSPRIFGAGGGAGGGGGSGGAGDANTGGGGGGNGASVGNPFPGGTGGSGVFIIRYPTNYRAAPTVSGNTPTPAQPGFNVYRWNAGPGTIIF